MSARSLSLPGLSPSVLVSIEPKHAPRLWWSACFFMRCPRSHGSLRSLQYIDGLLFKFVGQLNQLFGPRRGGAVASRHRYGAQKSKAI